MMTRWKSQSDDPRRRSPTKTWIRTKLKNCSPHRDHQQTSDSDRRSGRLQRNRQAQEFMEKNQTKIIIRDDSEDDMDEDQVLVDFYDENKTGWVRVQHLHIVVGRFRYSLLTDEDWYRHP